MKNLITSITISLTLLLTSNAFAGKGMAWTDPAKAQLEHPQFLLQGEYLGEIDGKKMALQVAAMDKNGFLVSTYKEGLPGAGWDGSKIDSKVLNESELKNLLTSYKKELRVSPTMGKKAPENASLTLPDDFTKVTEGYLRAGGVTKKHVGSFTMHLEFMVPYKPNPKPSNQSRGNSGIYIFNNYEVQIIDSFALDFNTENNAIKCESLNTQWCGSFYKMKLPDTQMAFPPLTWQTYDIDFTAPLFEGDKKVKNAIITVHHNGVKIHDQYELKSGTGKGATRKQLDKGPIIFQNHGNPVVFRNVWIVEK